MPQGFKAGVPYSEYGGLECSAQLGEPFLDELTLTLNHQPVNVYVIKSFCEIALWYGRHHNLCISGLLGLFFASFLHRRTLSNLAGRI